MEPILKASSSASTDDDGLARILEAPVVAMSSQHTYTWMKQHIIYFNLRAAEIISGCPRWSPAQLPALLLSQALQKS